MLQVYQLQKSFGTRKALDDATLQVDRGETLVVMGPSGCGKSTLLRAIHRLIRVDAGEMWFDDVPVLDLEGRELREYRRRIGFVFQHQNLIDHMTALENVALGPVMAGITPPQAIDLAQESLERVGLSALAAASPQGMSGGEKQRVAIARALAMKPELILWDEPTAGLDPMWVEEVLSIMAELAVAGETAMIVVTHEIPFALEVADRVALMDAGRVVLEGNPQEVLFASASPLSKRFRRLYEVRHAGVYTHVRKSSRRRNDLVISRSDQSQSASASSQGSPKSPLKGKIQAQ